MRVAALDLVDFRNHANLQLNFDAGNTTIVGRNGRGKTNIVEAINYIATLGSHRVATDTPLIRTGCEQAQITATIIKDDRQAVVKISINESKANKVTLNGNELTKPRDILGLVNTVVFAPEDLELVKGDPSARRKYLDDFSVQLSPRVAAVRADFEKVLKQKNALLKSAGRRKLSETAQATLDVWNEQFISHAVALTQSRLSSLTRLQPFIDSHGKMISGDTEPLTAKYSSKWLVDVTGEIEEQLRAALLERADDEIERGISLVGPHRDDLQIELSEKPAKGYASHGQSWSISLALRLATFNVLREFHDDPILILDDVFAELDVRRRQRLLNAIGNVEQTIITAAVAQDVPEELLSQCLNLSDED
jgi:DNA replication and repair protein RecF